jgi:hypothetical protein
MQQIRYVAVFAAMCALPLVKLFQDSPWAMPSEKGTTPRESGSGGRKAKKLKGRVNSPTKRGETVSASARPRVCRDPRIKRKNLTISI